MELSVKYIITSVFISVCSAQFTCTTLAKDLAECSSNYLSSDLPEIAVMFRGNLDFVGTATVLPYWKKMCPFKSKVKNYFTCSLNVVNGCLKNEYLGMYPEAARFNEGFDYACSSLNKLDVGCYQVEQNAIHTCAMSASGNAPSDTAGAQAMISHNCKLFASEVKCTGQNLNTCKDTKQVVEKYLSYLSRPVCGAMTLTSSLLLSLVLIAANYLLSY